MNDLILVIDFGSQFTQLIARRVRECHVYCEIVAYQNVDAYLKEHQPKGLILSGGPGSVFVDAAPTVSEMIWHLEVPILAICYGMQLMCHQLGGEVVQDLTQREFGQAWMEVVDKSSLWPDGLKDGEPTSIWMSHGDRVVQVPSGFQVIGSTRDCLVTAIADETRKFYGLQFHPELTHTQHGGALLQCFVCDICDCSAGWSMQNFAQMQLKAIAEQVGQQRVILGLSGGVDSSVAALLIHKAIGQQLVCVFIDNGLLRLGELEEVKRIFAQNFSMQLVIVDAKKDFLEALSGVLDPEEKRKVIGRMFIQVFEQAAAKLEGIAWLAQGTIYPDIIESAGQGSSAHTIKSHHNVGGLPEHLPFKLLEPLRMLFKDEVRQLGQTLGLSDDLVNRHPFPGPGLSVRVLGEVQEDALHVLRQADAIFIEELRGTHEQQGGQSWYALISQAFAVFLPVRSVGVMGDSRTYEHVIALRAVQTDDFMSATWVALPSELLAKVSTRIINEVPGINRVVYDISSKPPSTIEWE